MIRITIPFDFAYGGVRVVSLELGQLLPDKDEAALYAVAEGIGEQIEAAVKDAETSSAALPKWPLKTDPEAYLERTPNGPKADLARQILGL